MNTIPPVLAETLRNTARRIRRVLIARGLLATLAVVFTGLLIVMGIDAAVTIFNATLRLFLVLTVASAAAFVCYFNLLRPLARRYTFSELASLIEQRHPELQERLSTVVELLAMPETRARGSQQLVELLTLTAEADARGVSPKHEFTGRTIRPKAVAVVITLGVFGFLFAVWPRHTFRLVSRAVAPYAAIGNLYADNLAVFPGDATTLLAESFEIDVTVRSGFPGQPYVCREIRDTPAAPPREIAERMRLIPPAATNAAAAPPQTDAPRLYRYTLPAVDQPFRYRIACGYALTRHYAVTAVARPDLTNIVVSCVYPAYTKRPAASYPEGTRALTEIVGSRITLTADLNRPGLIAALSVNGVATNVAVAADRRISAAFPVAAPAVSSVTVFLTDAFGFTNFPAVFTIRGIADQAPTVRFTEPKTASVKLPVYAQAPFAFEITDDFGVTMPDLLLSLDNAPFQIERTLRADAIAAGGWGGSDAFDLAPLSFSPVSRVTLKLRVSDRRPAEYGGPQTCESAPLTIVFERVAHTFENQAIRQQMQAAQDSLKAASERLEQARQKVDELEKKTARDVAMGDREQQQLDQVHSTLAAAEAAVADTVAQLADTPLDRMSEKLDDYREASLTPLREKTEDVQLADAQAKPDLLKELASMVAGSVAETEATRKEVQAFAAKLERLQTIDELAQRERALTDTLSQATTPDQLRRWQNDQMEVARQVRNELVKNPETFQAQLEKHRAEVQAMQAVSEALADEHRNAAAEETVRQAGELRQQAEKITRDLQEFGAPAQPLPQKTAQASQALASAEQRARETEQALKRESQEQPSTATMQKQAAMREVFKQSAEALAQASHALDQKIAELQEQRDHAQPDGDLSAPVEEPRPEALAEHPFVRAHEKTESAAAAALDKAQQEQMAERKLQDQAHKAQDAVAQAQERAAQAQDLAAQAQKEAGDAQQAAHEAQARLTQHADDAENRQQAERLVQEAQDAAAQAQQRAQQAQLQSEQEQKKAQNALNELASVMQQADNGPQQQEQQQVQNLQQKAGEVQARAKGLQQQAQETQQQAAKDRASAEAQQQAMAAQAQAGDAQAQAAEAQARAQQAQERAAALPETKRAETQAAGEGAEGAQADARHAQQEAAQAQRQAEAALQEAVEATGTRAARRALARAADAQQEAKEAQTRATDAQGAAQDLQQQAAQAAAGMGNDAQRQAQAQASEAQAQAEEVQEGAAAAQKKAQQRLEAAQDATDEPTRELLRQEALQAQQEATAAQAEALQAQTQAAAAQAQAQPSQVASDTQTQAQRDSRDAAAALRESTRREAEALGIAPEAFASQQQPERAASQEDDSAKSPASGSGAKPPKPRDRSESPSSPAGKAYGPGEGKRFEAPVPLAMGGTIADADWFRIKGAASARALDDALAQVPSEYRDLVRLYFLELAKEGAK